MTKADLIEQVHQVIDVSRKDADTIVSAIFDSVVRALRSGNKVEIRGFGSFHTRQRRARGRSSKRIMTSWWATERTDRASAATLDRIVILSGCIESNAVVSSPNT